MKLIADISEMIEEELEGAENYIKHALKQKGVNDSLAKAFHEISVEEMEHVNILHNEVTKLIAEHRKTKGEPPAAMLAVYEYMHNKHIEKANKIKHYQSQFRE